MVDFEFEPERYELHKAPVYSFVPDRRDFLKLLGGGLVVLVSLPRASAQESGGGRGRGGAATPQDIGAWLHIAESGAITAYTGKVEMGQNIRTSLTQAVAEELRTAPSQIALVMGDTMLSVEVLGEPEVFFTTPGYDGWPLVMLRLAEVDVERLTELVTDAWRMRAPAALADSLDEADGQPRTRP